MSQFWNPVPSQPNRATCGWCHTPDQTYEHIADCRLLYAIQARKSLEALLEHLKPKREDTTGFVMILRLRGPESTDLLTLMDQMVSVLPWNVDCYIEDVIDEEFT